MKIKQLLSLIILIMALPTTSFAMHTYYYNSDTGDYYTIWRDAHGTTFITDLNTKVTQVKGNYYFDTYGNSPFYYNSPYYYNYYAYTPYPFINFGGDYNYYHPGLHGGYVGFGGFVGPSN